MNWLIFSQSEFSDYNSSWLMHLIWRKYGSQGSKSG